MSKLQLPGRIEGFIASKSHSYIKSGRTGDKLYIRFHESLLAATRKP